MIKYLSTQIAAWILSPQPHGQLKCQISSKIRTQGPPILTWKQYHYTKGSHPEVRKNHLRHYTLVPHVYIGFALSHCNRLQELTATMVTPRDTVPMQTCPSFRNDFYKRYSKSVTETPDKNKNVWFSRPMVPEVEYPHRKSRVVSDSTDGVTSSPPHVFNPN